MRRQHRSAAERSALIEAYRASGLSAEAFRARAGLPSSTFYQWLARERTAPPSKPIRMARVHRGVVKEATEVKTAAGALCVELGDAVVRISAGFDPVTLDAVLDVLERRKR
jgi:hypothetical protein